MRDEQITVLLKRNSEDKCAICDKVLPNEIQQDHEGGVVEEELISGVANATVKICAKHPRPKG